MTLRHVRARRLQWTPRTLCEKTPMTPVTAAIRAGAIAAILGLTPASAAALDPAKAIAQYVHMVWDGDHGLPQNSVSAIVQTRDGYIWFGTQEGLVRFDGVRFTVYDTRSESAF